MPRPAKALKFKPRDADGAADIAPGGGTHIGASSVASGGEDGDAEGVRVVGDGAPGFECPASGGGVASAACGVLVNEADGGEGAPAVGRKVRAASCRSARSGAGETLVTSAP